MTQMKALSDGRLRNPSTECNNIVLTKLDVVLTNMHQGRIKPLNLLVNLEIAGICGIQGCSYLPNYGKRLDFDPSPCLYDQYPHEDHVYEESSGFGTLNAFVEIP